MTETSLKLNLACGNKPLEGYVNLDHNLPKLKDSDDKFEIVIADVRDLSQYEENTVDEILASHIIEHFEKEEAILVLREWRRVLKPEGRLILECPNLIKCCINLLQELTTQEDKLTTNYGMFGIYGDPNVRGPGQRHMWGYTPETLMLALKQAGYTKYIETEPKMKPWAKDIRDMRIEAVK